MIANSWKKIAGKVEFGAIFASIGVVLMSLVAFYIESEGRELAIEKSTQQIAVRVVEQNISKITSEIEEFRELARSIDVEKIDDFKLVRALSQIEERVDSLERTLDTKPREIIEIVSLRSKIDDTREDAEATLAGLKREIDQLYGIVGWSLGALLISLLGLILGRVLSGRQQ